ncbi:MAG: hypothetical protein ACYC7E_08385 [Armatimonadota bacterium]
MARFLSILVLLALMTAAFSQQTTLTLSESLLSIRVTDPERQLTTFKPLLDYVDGLQAKFGATSTQPRLSQQLREGITALKSVPGIQMKGDFWFVIPSLPTPALPAAQPPADGATAPTPPPAPPVYLIAPLSDPEIFRAAVQLYNAPNVRIFGKFALAQVFGPVGPIYTGIRLDVQPSSRREVVALVHFSRVELPAAQEGPAAVFLAPIANIIKDLQANLRRQEIGLAMRGADLSAETHAIPVPDSPLAKQIAGGVNGTLAPESAAYLPENLAFCSATGPALAGVPGLGAAVMRGGSGLFALFLPEERQQPFLKSVEELVTLCSRGRALGITAPPANAPGEPALVAIYQVTGPAAAKSALHSFVNEIILIHKAFTGGLEDANFKLTLQAEAEKVGEIPVDLIGLKLRSQPPPPAADAPQGNAAPAAAPAPTELNLEIRAAYLNDKMLLTVGPGGKAEMAALLDRLQQRHLAFGATDRFQALKATMPEKIHAFATFASLDSTRVFANTFLQGKQKDDLLKMLSVFPPQQTVVSAYQEARDGILHGESQLPGEQMNFIYVMIKTIMEMAPAKPAVPPAK